MAIYLSKHLPDMLKACVSYKNGEYVKALEECYLKIDASIKTPEVLKEIQQLAKSSKGDDDEAAVDYEEENVGQLYEEATMPLDKLVAKFTHAAAQKAKAEEEEDPDCKPGSSKAMCSPGASGSTSKPGNSGSSSSGSGSAAGSSSAGASCSSASTKTNGEAEAASSSSATTSEPVKSENGVELIVQGKKIELEIPKEAEESVTEGKDAPSSSETEPVSSTTTNGSNGANGEKSKDVKPEQETGEADSSEKSKDAKPETVIKAENGEKDVSSSVSNGVSDKSEPKVSTNGVVSEGSGESTPAPRRKKVHPVRMPIPEEAKQETRSSPRKTGRPISFVAAQCLENSDSEDSEEDAGYKVGDKDSDDSSEDVDDEEEDLGEDSDDDDEDEYAEDDEEEEDERFLSDMQEPGYDSGATAVVCFMKWEGDSLSLWVANAGDSRCVVCREGKAIDMSHDHKPELDTEAKRIVRAGGRVTEDGRVNGGLNLSRALGDHSYKQNDTLPPAEQMISPLPDVEHIVLNPTKDKFLVLACDGIWNSMSSQEVVDFVGSRMEKEQNLSKICEEVNFKTYLFLHKVYPVTTIKFSFFIPTAI